MANYRLEYTQDGHAYREFIPNMSSDKEAEDRCCARMKALCGDGDEPRQREVLFYGLFRIEVQEVTTTIMTQCLRFRVMVREVGHAETSEKPIADFMAKDEDAAKSTAISVHEADNNRETETLVMSLDRVYPNGETKRIRSVNPHSGIMEGK